MCTVGYSLAATSVACQPQTSMVMDALPAMLKASPQLVRGFAAAWSGDRNAVKLVTPALRRLVQLCAGNYENEPRARKATVESMRNHDELTLLRAAWVSSYWHQHEFRGDLSDFGFTAIYDGKLLGIEPKQLDRAPTIGGRPRCQRHRRQSFVQATSTELPRQ